MASVGFLVSLLVIVYGGVIVAAMAVVNSRDPRRKR